MAISSQINEMGRYQRTFSYGALDPSVRGVRIQWSNAHEGREAPFERTASLHGGDRCRRASPRAKGNQPPHPLDGASPSSFKRRSCVEEGKPERRILQLDDVVALERELPSGETVSIYGLVTQVRARHEGARFDSDVFLIESGVLPAQVSRAAQLGVNRESAYPWKCGLAIALSRRQENDPAKDSFGALRRCPGEGRLARLRSRARHH